MMDGQTDICGSRVTFATEKFQFCFQIYTSRRTYILIGYGYVKHSNSTMFTPGSYIIAQFFSLRSEMILIQSSLQYIEQSAKVIYFDDSTKAKCLSIFSQCIEMIVSLSPEFLPPDFLVPDLNNRVVHLN